MVVHRRESVPAKKKKKTVSQNPLISPRITGNPAKNGGSKETKQFMCPFFLPTRHPPMQGTPPTIGSLSRARREKRVDRGVGASLVGPIRGQDFTSAMMVCNIDFPDQRIAMDTLWAPSRTHTGQFTTLHKTFGVAIGVTIFETQ